MSEAVGWILVVVVVGCVCCGLYKLSDRAERDCHKRGGEIVQTGSHLQSMVSGGTITTMIIPDYDCVVK